MLEFMKSLGRMPCNVHVVRLEDAFAYERVCIFKKEYSHGNVDTGLLHEGPTASCNGLWQNAKDNTGV